LYVLRHPFLSTPFFFKKKIRFIDCGIRPATSAEAEWLQDYIRKSNNTAAQQSVNAARLASEQAENQRAEDRSDEDDEDDSEGAGSSGNVSKRNSFVLGTNATAAPGALSSAAVTASLNGVAAAAAASGSGMKSPVLYHEELSDKTPTAANLLAHAQAAPRPGAFPTQATIRRHAGHEGALTIPSGLPGAPPNAFTSPSQPSATAGSIRHLPHFPSIEDALGSNPSNSTHSVIAREVWGWFLDHLDALLESVRYFRFDQFEMHVRSFWMNLTGSHREVVHAPAIAGLMAKGDAIVYDVSRFHRTPAQCTIPFIISLQEILETLRSQLLSTIPQQALTSLRGLADKMEKILLVSLENYGNTFLEPKVELGARFGHLVCKYPPLFFFFGYHHLWMHGGASAMIQLL
jgi:regulatory factor X, other